MYNNRKIVYITGISGTGKTTMARKFKQQGFITVDIDEYAHWEQKESREHAHWEPGLGREFLDTHEWVCDLESLKKIFEEHKQETILLFGVVDKEKEFFPLCNIIILLTCSLETAFKRIDSRDDNDFGKHEAEREWIRSWKDDFEKDLIARGAILVSSEYSIDIVMKNILNICKV